MTSHTIANTLYSKKRLKKSRFCANIENLRSYTEVVKLFYAQLN